MEVDLSGQVAVIRGMDGAWGRAVADRLEASGAHVSNGDPSTVRRARGRLDMAVAADPALIDGSAPFSAVDAATAFCTAAAAAMDGGRIVVVGSAFGVVPARNRADLSATCAALFARTRAMALDLAPGGVRLNAVAVLAENRPHTPLHRAATPTDVAGAVLFLLAAESSYVVGEVLRVDGGWSAGFAREF